MNHPIVTKKTYFLIFYILLGCTLLTVGISYLNLGPLSAVVAIGIAVFKASLVALYFMHLRYSSRIIWVFAGAGIFWLAILFALAFSDYLARTSSPAMPIDQNAFYERR